MALGILGAIGGLAGGFEQGLQARQNMQYRQALMALAQERVKAAQFEQQERLAQQQAEGLGYEAMLGHGGSGSLFKPLPTIGMPQPVPTQAPSPASFPPATPTSLSAGTAPMPAPASGASSYHPRPDVGGMATGGALFRTAAQTDAEEAGIDPGFYQTLIGAESNWNPRAVNPITVDGQHATGIAQFLPSTAKQQHVDPLDPQQSLKGGAQYFATLLRQNGGDYVKAAQAYGNLPENLNAIHTPGQRAVLRAAMAATSRHQAQATMRLGQALGGTPSAQRAQPLATEIVRTTPPAAVGQMNPMALMKTIAQRIEASAPPGTPDNVKAMAWMQAMTMYSKFAGPQMKMAFDMWKAQADFALRDEQIKALGGYRQAELGMRGAQIQSNNALRADTLASTNAYRQGMLQDRREQRAIEKTRLQRGPQTRPPPARSYQVKAPDGKVNTVFGTLQPDPSVPGKFTLLDTNGKPIAGEVIGGNAGGKGFGSAYATMVTSRQLVAVEQAVRDLAGVSKLPIGTSTGWMGIGAHRGTNIFDTSLDALKRDMTSNEVQLYNNRLVGINRAMAILSSGGVHITDYLTKSYEGLDIKPGDSYLSALDKLATLREDVDFAVDAMTAQPQTSQEQATIAKKFKGMVDKAIPWTTDDTVKLMSSNNPQMTLRQLGVRQTGEAGTGKQFGAGAGVPKAASTPPPQQYPQPSAQAITALKAKPGTAAQFDQVFGPGAAKRALGQ